MSTKAIEYALGLLESHFEEQQTEQESPIYGWAELRAARAELEAIRKAAKAVQKWGAGPVYGTASADDVEAYDAATDLLAAFAKESQ